MTSEQAPDGFMLVGRGAAVQYKKTRDPYMNAITRDRPAPRVDGFSPVAYKYVTL
jgi:hypothetical protein